MDEDERIEVKIEGNPSRRYPKDKIKLVGEARVDGADVRVVYPSFTQAGTIDLNGLVELLARRLRTGRIIRIQDEQFNFAAWVDEGRRTTGSESGGEDAINYLLNGRIDLGLKLLNTLTSS